ncbi:MAG: CBS domain-containing protein [Alphaproteobacteria bacterium]|nr:CBS domain-containing protein [Alphaproteobacteria bacterium]
MTVSALLKNKDHKIITISQTKTLQDVCNILTENRIGAIIVCSSTGLVEGIISERDVVKALGQSGATILTQQVSQHMTANPISCSSFETINQIMNKMTTGRFRHMPVMDGDKLIAVISIGDIVKARMEAMEHEAKAMQEYIGS